VRGSAGAGSPCAAAVGSRTRVGLAEVRGEPRPGSKGRDRFRAASGNRSHDVLSVPCIRVARSGTMGPVTLDRKAAAPLDQPPKHRVPCTPDLLSFLRQQAADDGRRWAEEHRHAARQPRIPKDIPSGQASHHGRLDRKHHAADPGLPDRKGAHGAGLHDRVERAPLQPLRLEPSLGL